MTRAVAQRAAILFILGWPMSLWADDDPGELRIYPTHGSPTHVLLQGRHLENEGVRAAKPGDGRLRNFVRAAKELESDEIEGSLIRVTLAGQTFEARTDDDGLFRIEATLTTPLAPGPTPVVAQAVEDRGHPTPPALGTVYILPATPSVAVISDFDDTVAVSHITSKRAMVRTALLENATQVQAVAGGPEAYRRALAAGAVAVFYVSGSPQNFINRIKDFLDYNGYPQGPIELKNFGSDPTFNQAAYKPARLQAILDAHPNTRFVLVGDSSEHDPEIFRALRDLQPTRILGIVIRQVPEADNRPERFVGTVVVPDFAGDPDVLARLLKPGP